MILYILVGVPGSGKSYYAKNHMMVDDSCIYVSRDDVRFSMVKEDEQYFSKEKEVYREFIHRISMGLRNKAASCVIADATHLNWPSRRKLLYGLEWEILTTNTKVIPVMFTTDLAVALERNKHREGRACVPDKVIAKMYKKMTDPKNDIFDYDNIIYINGKEENK